MPVKLSQNELMIKVVRDTLKLYNIFPKQVYVNKGNTTVEWSDGVKTTVGIHNERFDIEKGIAMAIVKRLMPRAEFIRLMENGQYQNQNFYYVATWTEVEM